MDLSSDIRNQTSYYEQEEKKLDSLIKETKRVKKDI